MAKVLLVSAAQDDPDRFPEFALDDLHRMQASADADRFGVHELTTDPEEADVILFVERAHATGRYMEDVRRHPLVDQYREKCFVSNSRYFGVPFLPGVYGCVRKKDISFTDRVRSGTYLEVNEKDAFSRLPDVDHPQYLYSFVGSVFTWPQVRGELAKFEHDRGLFIDTSTERKEITEDGTIDDADDYVQRYVDICRNSAFVLCPRGDATSSMRLFESMRMGRAPVIIADEWLYPEGPDWASCSVHIPEDEIDRIPEILERLEPRAAEMGRNARQTWEDWFSPEATFHRVTEWCLEMQEKRTVPERLLQAPVWLKLLLPFHLRRYLGSRYRMLRNQGRLVL